MTLTLWVFGLVFISLPGAHGLTSFPENFVVAKKDGTVTLTCDVSSPGAVMWKFEQDGEINELQEGQNLTVSDVDSPVVGEYSCWRGGEKLSSVYLLLDAEEEDPSDLESLFSCRAQSYNCNFSCTWTHSEYTAVRLGLGKDCNVDKKSCHWVNSSPDPLSEGGFHFELYHSLSPYAEESTMLTVTAEAIDEEYFFLRLTKRFYLRDIIQPDIPTIVRCQEEGQELNVTIDPPSSWSTPHSFFSLEHEIEYVLRDDGTTKCSLSTLIPKRISKLRARCRDSLVRSAWSQWTPWKNVLAGKKKLCKCRNTVKYCCPQLSSEDMLHCKRKQRKKAKSKAN